MGSKVDAFFEQAVDWREVMVALRAIAIDCGLGESWKWGKPCYTFRGANLAIIQPFKKQCGLMFFKGALLHDPRGLLEKPGPNAHAARRMMYTRVDDVAATEPFLRAFIAEAIALEKAGRGVPEKPDREPIPDELAAMYETVPGLQAAFEALTPGRQRGYILHTVKAKQSKTRSARIEKCLPKILAGKGLHD